MTAIDQGRKPVAWDWRGDREGPAKSEGRARTHRLDWSLVTYWLALLVCGAVSGLVIGGYVGYMEAATPAVDAPGGLTHLATSDVQWVTMVRQHWAASHRPSDLAAENAQEPSWLRLARGVSIMDSAGDPRRVLWPVAPGVYLVREAQAQAQAVRKVVIAR
jgi:hypothetical protein